MNERINNCSYHGYNVKGYDTHDILIVSTLNDIDDRMKRIRVFVKESEWNK